MHLLVMSRSAQATAVDLLTGHLHLLAQPKSLHLFEVKRDMYWENYKVKEINYLL